VINVRWLISVRSGLCTSAQLGGFITSLPTDIHLNDTSIYTTPLKFTEGSFPTPNTPVEDEPISTPEAEPISTPEKEESGEIVEEGEILDNMERSHPADITRRQWDIIESITNGVKGASSSGSEDTSVGSEDMISENEESGERQGEGAGGGAVYEVPQYTGPVHYKVPKTGYYCVGTFLRLSHLLHSISRHPISVYTSQLTIEMESLAGRELINRYRTSNIIKSTDYQTPGESR
jgi:hypothetical protein